jgi:hypothetical protein
MAARSKKFRFEWLEVVFSRHDLSAGAQVVAFGLSSFWNPVKDCAWPSYETLAKKCGMTAAGARKAIVQLRELGLIEAKKRGFQTSLSYHLCIPANVSLSGQVGERPMCPAQDAQCVPLVAPNSLVEPSMKISGGEEEDSRGKQAIKTGPSREAIIAEYLADRLDDNGLQEALKNCGRRRDAA